MKNTFKLSAVLLSILAIVIMTLPSAATAAALPTYPTSINGMPVVLVEDSSNSVSVLPGNAILFVYDKESPTIGEAVAKFDSSKYLVNYPLPRGWSIAVFGGSGATVEKFLEIAKNDNANQKQYGPIKWGPLPTTNVVTTSFFQSTGNPSFAYICDTDTVSPTISYQSAMWNCPSMGSWQDNYSAVVNNIQTDGIYTLQGVVHNWFLQSGQGYTLNLWGDNGWADDSDNWTFHSYHIPYHPSDQMVFEVYLNPLGPGWVQTGYNVSQNFYLAHFASYVSGTHAIPTTNTCIFFENGNTASGWWSGFTNPINIYSARNGTYNNQKAWNGQQIAILDNNGSWQPNTGEISGSLVNYGTAHFWLAYMLLGRN